MAHQKIEGPYRVLSHRDHLDRVVQWEIVEIVDEQPVPLRPKLVYEKEKRASAYRRLALLNRRWQREQVK